MDQTQNTQSTRTREFSKGDTSQTQEGLLALEVGGGPRRSFHFHNERMIIIYTSPPHSRNLGPEII